MKNKKKSVFNRPEAIHAAQCNFDLTAHSNDTRHRKAALRIANRIATGNMTKRARDKAIGELLANLKAMLRGQYD